MPKLPCPTCQSTDEVVPAVYGLPTDEVMEKAQRKEVYLGGCIIMEPILDHFCKTCYIMFDGKGNVRKVGKPDAPECFDFYL